MPRYTVSTVHRNGTYLHTPVQTDDIEHARSFFFRAVQRGDEQTFITDTLTGETLLQHKMPKPEVA